ncbi:type II toxin-antitoxin system HicA family toxin [Humidesulfovibrio sp.]
MHISLRINHISLRHTAEIIFIVKRRTPCTTHPFHRPMRSPDFWSTSAPLDLSPQVSTIHHVNSKHRKTLAAVFSEPTRSDIPWAEIEALLVACGAKLREGSGSRVRIELAGFSAVFHRPHPRTVTDRGSVRSARRFLRNAGVKP